jgi:uncharacterized SAM-binding protein YcdF (DUF218 family)
VTVTATVSSGAVAAPVRRRSAARVVIAAVLVVLAVALVVLPGVAGGLVALAARQDDRTPTDVVVVLGAAQFNGRPSPVLVARLAHARELHSDAVAPHVVTVGANQPGDRTTEAAVGASWLVAQGVPRADVTAVPEGHDTLSSLTAVARVMADHGWTRATIVTDPAHEARSLAMARALGIEAHGSPTRSGSGSSLTAEYLARETGGLLYFWVLERRGIEPVVGV